VRTKGEREPVLEDEAVDQRVDLAVMGDSDAKSMLDNDVSFSSSGATRMSHVIRAVVRLCELGRPRRRAWPRRAWSGGPSGRERTMPRPAGGKPMSSIRSASFEDEDLDRSSAGGSSSRFDEVPEARPRRRDKRCVRPEALAAIRPGRRRGDSDANALAGSPKVWIASAPGSASSQRVGRDTRDFGGSLPIRATRSTSGSRKRVSCRSGQATCKDVTSARAHRAKTTERD